jgi:site-specific recombinase XerD
MALRLYRRHRNDCEAHRPEGSFSGEFEEGRKGWRRCACLIHASGTLSGKFNRRQTGKSRWEEARAVSAEWELAGSWDAQFSHCHHLPRRSRKSPRKRHVWQSSKQPKLTWRGARTGTSRRRPCKIQDLHESTPRLCGVSRVRYLDQLTVADMDRFYGSWRDGIRSKAKKLERLKSFVKFCLKREWLKKDIADDLEAPEGSSVTVPKAPFTDEELNRIFEACDAIGMDGFGPNRRNWTGEDVKDFILLSIYTGMRISDVATFEVTKRLSGKVFDLAGPFEEKTTPHRFRHIFVRILLEKGVPVPDVAELIGDTQEIVRKHYSRWIASRQDRLTKILQQAFEDKPTPKVVAINRGA